MENRNDGSMKLNPAAEILSIRSIKAVASSVKRHRRYGRNLSSFLKFGEHNGEEHRPRNAARRPIRCRRTAGLVKVPLGPLKEIVAQWRQTNLYARQFQIYLYFNNNEWTNEYPSNVRLHGSIYASQSINMLALCPLHFSMKNGDVDL